MATQRRLHPVARLLEALEAEKVRYMLIGMSAAIVQGVIIQIRKLLRCQQSLKTKKKL